MGCCLGKGFFVVVAYREKERSTSSRTCHAFISRTVKERMRTLFLLCYASSRQNEVEFEPSGAISSKDPFGLQIYGRGKNTLGANFKEFILRNKEYLSLVIDCFSGDCWQWSEPWRTFTGSPVNIYVDLSNFRVFEGENVRPSLLK